MNVNEMPEWARFQASLTDHPVVMDKHGVLRYKASPIHGWLCDHIDLNEMSVAYQQGAFGRDEFMQFYRDIGYSLGGFEEIWGEELDEMEGVT